MPQHLLCFSCHRPLVIRDGSPPTLTCPGCLARINNPHPYAAPPPRDITASPPMRVVPLDHEVNNDLAGAHRTIVLAAIAMIVGGFIWLGATRSPMGIVLVVAGLIFAGVMTSVMRARTERVRHLAPDDESGRTSGIGAVLEYARPRSAGGRGFGGVAYDTTGWTIARFIGGFFLGLAFCVLCLFIFGGSYSQQRAAKGVIFIAVAAVWIALAIGAAAMEHRGTALGLGRGACVGLLLGLMALGPCALCYLGS